jgi:hypothetical protein
VNWNNIVTWINACYDILRHGCYFPSFICSLYGMVNRLDCRAPLFLIIPAISPKSMYIPRGYIHSIPQICVDCETVGVCMYLCAKISHDSKKKVWAKLGCNLQKVSHSAKMRLGLSAWQKTLRCLTSAKW